VVELQEEATQVWVAAVMAEACAAWAEKMAQERAVLLATAHGEADEAPRGSLL
jgi:type II secretory pathway component PulM